MIPIHIKIKNNALPDNPGVYFYFDIKGNLLYIGKATSLKRRVGSYFTKTQDPSTGSGNKDRIADLVSKIAKIDFIETPTVIEALVLEANQIKAKKPKFNVLQRDDKSFLYLVVTNEDFPRPLLMRGQELERLGINPFSPKLSAKTKKKFLRVFGPYTSGSSLRKALDLIRRIIPWSDCTPPQTPINPPLVRGETRASSPLYKGGYRGVGKPCFNVHIKKCPGVCSGAIKKKDYKKIMRLFILFFEGKKPLLIKQLKKDMKLASKELRFEDAKELRNKIFALEHIRDIALIAKEDFELPYQKTNEDMIDLNGRIEAYDISNISGTSAVGSMVVFEQGKPAKDKYRRFKIKTVKGADDYAMLEEVVRRRLKRAKTHKKVWPLPEIMIIDGGKGQISRVQKVLNETKIQIPIIGIAKGFDRKQDCLVFDRENLELSRITTRGKELFQKTRDEAHRFALAYHRKLRGKKSLAKHNRKS